MRDRINDTVKELDEIGRSIYLAERAGWSKLVSMVGIPSTFASAIDVLSIIVGVSVFVLTSGTLHLLGTLLALSGILGTIRRVLA